MCGPERLFVNKSLVKKYIGNATSENLCSMMWMNPSDILKYIGILIVCQPPYQTFSPTKNKEFQFSNKIAQKLYWFQYFVLANLDWFLNKSFSKKLLLLCCVLSEKFNKRFAKKKSCETRHGNCIMFYIFLMKNLSLGLLLSIWRTIVHTKTETL